MLLGLLLFEHGNKSENSNAAQVERKSFAKKSNISQSLFERFSTCNMKLTVPCLTHFFTKPSFSLHSVHEPRKLRDLYEINFLVKKNS